MYNKDFFRTLRGIIVTMVLLMFSVACGKDDGGETTATSAVLKYSVVDCETTRNQLLLTGGNNLTFTATIVSGAEWLSFSADKLGETVKTGPVTPVVFVYSQRNTTPDDRTARVVVEFSNNDSYEVALTQQKYTSSATFDKPWPEQPQYESNSSYIYKTYFTTLSNSQYARSYSMCYDVNRKVAHWVAYPLHTVYTTPNVGRTDAWSYDPNVQLPAIPNEDQQYILKGYGVRGYDRGHQCPSADRVCTVDTNKQTFYATNMMPQSSSLNQGIWGKLETKVRENIKKDTLYVVTGTDFADSKTITDRGGNEVAVPSSCWKVLLRTKSGSTGKRIQDCTADELVGIGFWFANDSYNTGSLASYSKSIAEIEEMTGFTFFHNLPPDAAASVKSQNNPSVWNIN